MGMEAEDGGRGRVGGGGGGGIGPVDGSVSSISNLIDLSASSIHPYSKQSEGRGTSALQNAASAGGGCEEAIAAREAIKAEGERSWALVRPKPPRETGSERVRETR
jgi:hypothetical protein